MCSLCQGVGTRHARRTRSSVAACGCVRLRVAPFPLRALDMRCARYPEHFDRLRGVQCLVRPHSFDTTYPFYQ